MTTSPYGPATKPAPISIVTRVLRVVLAGTLVLAGLAAAALTALVAWITYTGCFIGCSNPQPEQGGLLGLLAVGLLAAGPLLARVMWRTTSTPRSLTIWSVLVLGIPTALVMLSGLGAVV